MAAMHNLHTDAERECGVALQQPVPQIVDLVQRKYVREAGQEPVAGGRRQQRTAQTHHGMAYSSGMKPVSIRWCDKVASWYEMTCVNTARNSCMTCGGGHAEQRRRRALELSRRKKLRRYFSTNADAHAHASAAAVLSGTPAARAHTFVLEVEPHKRRAERVDACSGGRAARRAAAHPASRRGLSGP